MSEDNRYYNTTKEFRKPEERGWQELVKELNRVIDEVIIEALTK